MKDILGSALMLLAIHVLLFCFRQRFDIISYFFLPLPQLLEFCELPDIVSRWRLHDGCSKECVSFHPSMRFSYSFIYFVLRTHLSSVILATSLPYNLSRPLQLCKVSQGWILLLFYLPHLELVHIVDWEGVIRLSLRVFLFMMLIKLCYSFPSGKN